MTFDDYQKQSAKSVPDVQKFKDLVADLKYVGLGLGGEAGEVLEKIKKIMRDGSGTPEDERKDDLIKELGDVMWYMARICDILKVNMSDVAKINIDKVMSRVARDKMQGDGDNR